MRHVFAVAVICTSMFNAGSALAEDKTFPDNAKKVWIERTNKLVDASNARTDSADSYIDGLKSACSGLTSETFSVRQPYWAMRPQGTFCIAVGELDKEANGANSNVLGRTKMFAVGEYCRQFSAAIGQANSIQNTPENASIYESAQKLSAAAEKIKSNQIDIHIATRTLGGFGASGADSHRTKVMSCH
jgi:hypothetical protein